MEDELIPWADMRCKWCEARLPLERDPRRQFCDNDRACQTAYFNDLRSARYLLARLDKTCAECGATFTRQKSRAIYCSRACAVKACDRAGRERRKAAINS